ncbi:chemotaxis protein [Streptomyces sp. GC420]|uniref:baeRF3 domain-containing protein n=1 Tax=Streptomyces sp. GC420 TaxID=2697568 RepID=UPI001415247B|nr:chemotaxis protein [Streptomyces sp. GC420]NBM17780.1 chemotaxis protein [Streptomyces sp. GC420]
MQPELTSSALADLRRPRPYPALSLLMPTHRREPESMQDPVRLRNLVARAKKQLEEDPAVTRQWRMQLGKELDAALAEVNLVYSEDGLVIFAAPGEHQVWKLPRPVPERIVLSDTFLTRNLVAAQAIERPFWVLAVAADRVALFSGDTERVVEARTGGFPLTRSLEFQDIERMERVGNVPEPYNDDDTRLFLRQADTALDSVLAADPRPLFVTGDPAALSLLDDAGSASKGATRIPRGAMAHSSPNAVWQAVRPFVAAEEEKERAAVLQELGRARDKRTLAAGVDEVWQSAKLGSVRLLVVEDNFRVTVRAESAAVTEPSEHLAPAESGDLDAIEDMVDDIIERCLDTGAEVRFVPDGTIEGMDHIAAALRF